MQASMSQGDSEVCVCVTEGCLGRIPSSRPKKQTQKHTAYSAQNAAVWTEACSSSVNQRVALSLVVCEKVK